MKTGTSKVLLALVALFAVAWLVQAGSLEPPGPPGPTMKPLDQVEPRIPLSNAAYSIPASGSYYLTENIASATPLVIMASDVTLDLNGFTISAVGSPAAPGIRIQAAVGVEIHDGAIRGFEHGIELTQWAEATLTRLRLHDNTANGLRVESSDVVVRDCSVLANGAAGIDISSDGTSYDLGTAEIIDNTIRFNATHGIVVDSAFLYVEGNRVHMNGAEGIVVSMCDAQILHNIVTSNGSNGIHIGLSVGSVFENRTFSNGDVGILATDADPSLQCAKNVSASNLGGDYDLDPAATSAPIVTLSGSPGALDNVARTPPAP